MWFRKISEDWLYDLIEKMEIVILEYLKILYWMLFRPPKALNQLFVNNVVSPLVLFTINVILSAILGKLGNIIDSISKISRIIKDGNLNLIFDDGILSLGGLILGSIVFILLLKLAFRVIENKHVNSANITRAIIGASFLFIPIIIFEKIIDSVNIGQALQILSNPMSLVGVFSRYLVFNMLVIWWWSYIVILGLKLQLVQDIKYIRCFVIALILLFALSNFQTVSNSFTLLKLIKYNETAKDALAKQPPDYLTAAYSTGLIAQTPLLTPYQKYYHSIRSAVYLSNSIAGFDTRYVMSCLINKKFDDLEYYYNNNYSAVNSANHTQNEYYYLKILKETLNNAAKYRKDENYILSQDETTILIKIMFSNTIKIIP